jgi:hypothetical protein
MERSKKKKKKTEPVALPPSARVAWRPDASMKASAGGQATVIGVQRVGTNQPYAMKVLSASDPVAIQRFRNEIAVLKASVHPNIMPLIDSGERWYVMPRGVPLDDVKPPASVVDLFAQGVRIFLAILSAIEKLHADGHLHRDIKPSNVIFLKDVDRIVLSDFGVVQMPDTRGKLTKMRAITNRHYKFIPILYDHEAYDTRMDCAQLVHLLCWILAQDRARAVGYYHWRYHRFVDDNRCEFARSLLALYGNLELAPRNAAALRRHVEVSMDFGEGPKPSDEQIRRIKEQEEKLAIAKTMSSVREDESITTLGAVLVGADAGLQKVARYIEGLRDGGIGFSAPSGGLSTVHAATGLLSGNRDLGRTSFMPRPFWSSTYEHRGTRIILAFQVGAVALGGVNPSITLNAAYFLSDAIPRPIGSPVTVSTIEDLERWESLVASVLTWLHEFDPVAVTQGRPG